MLKSRGLKKAVSVLCVLCMLFLVFAGGTIAYAVGDKITTTEAVAQNSARGVKYETQGEKSSHDICEDDKETIESDDSEKHFSQKAETVRRNAEPVKGITYCLSEYGVINESVPDAKQKKGAAPGVGETRSIASNDLSDFLVDLIINAPQDESGNYIINPNSSYDMTFVFGENESFQFDDEGVLIYNFPDGVIMSDIGNTAFSLTVVDENGIAIVYDNIFEVADNRILVHFNQNDPNFERLKAMPNVSFSITVSSSFDETAGEIVFSENIVKDFVYEETSDLGIHKSVVYDKETNTAYYDLQIISEGLNENVVIKDWLTGTALVFNQDVVVESGINGIFLVSPDYTSVENGFQVSIPQLIDGEVLTLRYSAAVDNTKITYNGSVEQTNNTARVISDQVPEGKEVNANFAGQVTFQKISKFANGDPVEVGDGIYEQVWTILVNADKMLPMGGTYIYDWIAQNSRPFMQFTGSGITVNVTFENGETETRIVPWSRLYLYTDSNGTVGWRYLAPLTDGNATYVITCTTLINTSGALGALTLVNGTQVYGTYEEGTVTVGPIGESNFGIRKDAISTTSTETEWKITITVPGSGLPEFHVVDDMPKLEYNGQTYIDYYVPDSMRVEGLLQGESWRLSIGSSERSFTVTFYQSETQNDANKGVLPTPDGQPREIVIRYKTSVNQDWLNLAAEDRYASSKLYRHRNYACAWSGSYRTETVNAFVVPVKPELIKDFVECSDIEINGVTYPVFNYRLLLIGVVEDGAVIQDIFDKTYLRYFEGKGIEIHGCYIAGSSDYNANGAVSVNGTADGIEFEISNFPKQNNGDFYPYYTLHYSLIVKDQDALNALNVAAAASQNGISLDNTASWDSIESHKMINYTYFPYVDKELLTRPTAENGYVAEFEVIINKYAEDLDPTSDVLAIQDVLSSNLRFIPDSLTITPGNDMIIVQHDDETNTLTFTEVPDETTFMIRYQARVLGSGNVTYSNTVKFGKFEKKVEETAVVESSGGGTGSNPSITLVKRDSEILSKTLTGATFQLFYLDNGSQIPVQDKNGENVCFTTGQDGRVLIIGHLQNLGWTLWADRTYCLVEIVAPNGYEINNEPVYFILTKNPASQIEFGITGDQLSVKNDAVKISVSVIKRWVGPVGADEIVVHLLANGNDTGKTIRLTAEGNWSGSFDELRKYDEAGNEIQYTIEEEPVNNYAPRYDGSAEDGFTIINTNTETIDIPVLKTWIGPAAGRVTVELLADGVKVAEAVLNEADGWQHTFTDLLKYDGNDGHEIVYTIREISIDGYSTEITGDQSGYTIINTNTETIEIPVVKQWVGPAAESVTIMLYADGEVIAEVALNAENDWQHTFTDLPKYDSTDGHEIEYDVQEVPVEGYEQGRSGSVETGFTFTNTITGKVSIPVTKTWIGPAAESVTVELLADGVKVAESVLNEANGWQYTFTDLDQYNNGVEIIYTIREVSITGYSSKINGNMDDGFIITNMNTETLNIPVEKRWVGTAADSVTIRLYADSVMIADIVLNKSNNWQYSFTALPKYDSTDGHEIVYTISEDSLSGYTTSITGDMHTGFVITNTKTTTPPPPDSPKTGDDLYPMLYIIALILSGAGLLWTVIFAKGTFRRKEA